MSAARSVRGQLLAAERRPNTRNGNPVWFLVVACKGGDVIYGRTQPDGMVGFEVSSIVVGSDVEVGYSAGANGLTFHRIDRVQP